jgi:hypothetical protein
MPQRGVVSLRGDFVVTGKALPSALNLLPERRHLPGDGSGPARSVELLGASLQRPECFPIGLESVCAP